MMKSCGSKGQVFENTATASSRAPDQERSATQARNAASAYHELGVAGCGPQPSSRNRETALKILEVIKKAK